MAQRSTQCASPNQATQCALPDCHVLVEAPEDGSLAKKYCCREHRFAARRLRSVERAEEQSEVAEVDQIPVAEQEDFPACVGALPVVDLPVAVNTAGPRTPAVKPSTPNPGPAVDPVKLAIGRAVKQITDAELIPAATLRSQRERPIGRSPRTARPAPSHGRRGPGRIAVTVGVTAMLAGGAWWAAQGGETAEGGTSNALSGPSYVAPPAVPDLPSGAEQWAANTQIALTSVNTQLQEINNAESAWNALPAERRVGPQSRVMAQLLARKTELTKQQNNLQAELNTWQRMQQARTALIATESQMSGPAKSTADAKPATPSQQATNPPHPAALLNQAQAQQKTIVGLLPAVHDAMAKPTPVITDTVAPVASAVNALVGGPTHNSAPATQRQQPTTGRPVQAVPATSSVAPTARPTAGQTASRPVLSRTAAAPRPVSTMPAASTPMAAAPTVAQPVTQQPTAASAPATDYSSTYPAYTSYPPYMDRSTSRTMAQTEALAQAHALMSDTHRAALARLAELSSMSSQSDDSWQDNSNWNDNSNWYDDGQDD